MQKGFTQIHLLVAGIIALLIGVGVYLYSQDKLLFITWKIEQNSSKYHATLDLKTGKLSF